MNYKTYAEAKIANPDCEIVTTGKNWAHGENRKGLFEPLRFYSDAADHKLSDDAWVICNPADYCSSVKEFLEAGFEFSVGDFLLNEDGIFARVNLICSGTNKCEDSDDKRYILSAAALNGGCKIPAKDEQWSVHNNTLQLCELTDEQASMLFNAWRGGAKVELLADDDSWRGAVPDWSLEIAYRIKQKSERKLFIEAAIGHGIKPGTQSPKQIFGELFDSGKFKYIDSTSHFGENI